MSRTKKIKMAASRPTPKIGLRLRWRCGHCRSRKKQTSSRRTAVNIKAVTSAWWLVATELHITCKLLL